MRDGFADLPATVARLLTGAPGGLALPGAPERIDRVAAIQVCAPVLLALILTDAALGIVSKVVPQINVFAVGFPAKVAVGLLLVGVSLPFAAGWLSDELQRSVTAALQSLKVA